MPVAMALLRDVQNLCPKDVLNFILDLIKYNDNRKNKVKTHIHTFLFSNIEPVKDLFGFNYGQSLFRHLKKTKSSLIECCYSTDAHRKSTKMIPLFFSFSLPVLSSVF